MVLVIDASNIQTGGGLHHLVELLYNGNPPGSGFERVIVCAPSETLKRIEERPWLEKSRHSLLDKSYFSRWRWRRAVLPGIVKSQKGFLFCAGTLKPPFHWPYVTICQNLLPIELRELLRFGFSIITLRLLALRYFHFESYKHARGVIFLTQYCFNMLPPSIKMHVANYTVIPHGLNRKLFFELLHKKKKMEGDPFFLLYVSIINAYKHQDQVVRAVINLNRKGTKVKLTLVGPGRRSALQKLNRILFDRPDYAYAIDYHRPVPYEKIGRMYQMQDGFIFASTCETFGMIITEAMATGLPILCSKKSSLPETVQDAAIYFDPESVESIEQAIERLVVNQKLQRELSAKSLERAREFTWDKCSEATFEFLGKAAKVANV
jgi:glycosyltransferase involved in cell wall biosynthesis